MFYQKYLLTLLCLPIFIHAELLVGTDKHEILLIPDSSENLTVARSTLSSLVALTALEQQYAESVVTGPKEPNLCDQSTILMDSAFDLAVQKVVVDIFGLEEEGPCQLRPRLNKQKTVFSLIKAIKYDANTFLDMTIALIDNNGMPNYRIDRLFDRWQMVNDRLVFAIAKINPDINKEKLAYLLEKRRIELFYYSQSLIFNKLAPSEQHSLALDIHTRIPLEYSQEIEFYLFK